MRGSKEETILELAPPEKTQVSTAGSLLRENPTMSEGEKPID